jgi:transcriptional regulator with XRE-family HTH domain
MSADSSLSGSVQILDSIAAAQGILHAEKDLTMTAIASRIRRARSVARITQSELARRTGVQRSAVTQWESGEGTTPSVVHLAQIAIETSVCFEWLATGRGPSRPDAASFDTALVIQDFARDEIESRALNALRQVTGKKREVIVKVIELLAG